MTAQELQLLVSIVAGVITIVTVFVGLVVNAWRGGTGTIRRSDLSSGSTGTEGSLDAPAAGTAQTLTINTTTAWANASGASYRLLVIGTPT